MWQGSPSSQNLFHRTTRNMNRVRYPRHIMTFTDVNSDTDEDKTFDSDMQFDVEVIVEYLLSLMFNARFM